MWNINPLSTNPAKSSELFVCVWPFFGVAAQRVKYLFRCTVSQALNSGGKWGGGGGGGGAGKKTKNKKPKFLKLLILVHLRNYFIEALNKFLMCFEINGLKNFKLTTLMIFYLFCTLPHPSYLYYWSILFEIWL